MDLFLTCFIILCILSALLFFGTKTVLPTPNDINYIVLQRAYLVVYLLAIAGDWLQGPYVYALYQSYGLTAHQIEILFVAGFGSSMIMGTFVGALADKYGRRFNCILYGILYGCSCLTKHFSNFWILMGGRLLGGISTSILYSAFESWLIYESNSRCIDSSGLSAIFSRAYMGNSIVAIASGLAAQFVANQFGYVASFDLAFIVLAIMIVAIVFNWSENHGNHKINIHSTFLNAFTHLKNDYKIVCLGIIQSLFEGCMYTFVLEWTPALSLKRVPTLKQNANIQNNYEFNLPYNDTPTTYTGNTIDEKNVWGASQFAELFNRIFHLPGERITHQGFFRLAPRDDFTVVEDKNIPHGYIFAAFMIAIMIGSFIFKILSKHSHPESYMRYVLGISSVCFLIPISFPGWRLGIFVAFLVFETCVGIFWPTIAMLRGKYVPEETRSTIMNIFRVPLNMIVIAILIQNLHMQTIFGCCFAFLALSSGVQHIFYRFFKGGQYITGDNERKPLINTSGEKNHFEHCDNGDDNEKASLLSNHIKYLLQLKSEKTSTPT